MLFSWVSLSFSDQITQTSSSSPNSSKYSEVCCVSLAARRLHKTHTELTWAQNPRQAHNAIFRRLTQFSWEYPGFWHPAHIYRSALELLGSQHYWTHTGLIDSPETWKSKHKHEIDIYRHSVRSYGQKRKKTCFFPPPFNII